MMTKKRNKILIFLCAIGMLCAVFALAFCSLPQVFAIDEGLVHNILEEPSAPFVQGGSAVKAGEEAIYTLWTPTNIGHIRYGTSGVPSEMTPITVTEENSNQWYTYPNGTQERANRYFLRIKYATNMMVKTYLDEDEEKTFVENYTIPAEILKKKLDGISPRIAKNTLKPSLDGNQWNINFTVEEPTGDTQYFWAQSGIKSIKIVKKVRLDNTSDPIYEQVGDNLWTYNGGNVNLTKKANISCILPNLAGEYLVELMDQVGNARRVTILNIDTSSEQYYEAITLAVHHSGDLELNLGLREEVSRTLDAFLEALNENKTGDPFKIIHQAFQKAMTAARIAYENGRVAKVSIENEEYLAGTLSADFTTENYAGKVLYGDNLELRISIAAFDYADYKNAQAAAVSQIRGATLVLRLNIKLLYNGLAVPFATPVKVYMTIPRTYEQCALVSVAGTDIAKIELQSGEEWVMFTVSENAAFVLFVREKGAQNMQYLWLLLLIVPLGGAVAYLIYYSRKRKGKDAAVGADTEGGSGKPERFGDNGTMPAGQAGKANSDTETSGTKTGTASATEKPQIAGGEQKMKQQSVPIQKNNHSNQTSKAKNKVNNKKKR